MIYDNSSFPKQTNRNQTTWIIVIEIGMCSADVTDRPPALRNAQFRHSHWFSIHHIEYMTITHKLRSVPSKPSAGHSSNTSLIKQYRRRHWITWSTLYSIACMIYICFLINAAKYLFIHSSWFTIILDWTGFYRIDVCRKMYEFIRYIYCLTAFQSRHTIRRWAQPHRLTPNRQLINLRTKKKCRIFCGRGNSFFVYF